MHQQEETNQDLIISSMSKQRCCWINATNIQNLSFFDTEQRDNNYKNIHPETEKVCTV